MKTLTLLLLLSLSLSLNVSYAITLEDMPQYHHIQNSKICFYPGSFDPFHEGHANIVTTALVRFCEYVLIYPSWGNDNSYKPNLSPLKDRQDALNQLYGKHKQVLLTNMPPKKLYEFFKNKRDFIALIGSDTAHWLNQDKKLAPEFASGAEPEKNDNWGGSKAIKADSFIIFLRGKDQSSDFQKMLLDREILAIIDQNPELKEISSTKIRHKNNNAVSKQEPNNN